MSGINNIGNLQRNGVKPLRPSAGMANKGQVAQRFDVDALRNGGSLDLGTILDGQESLMPAPEQSLQGKLQAPKAYESNRQKANARLSYEEKREKLEKIHNASQQYEAMYVDHFLKQMRQSPFAKMPGGELYQDIAEMPMRDHLSRSGGLGLSGVITEQVARQEGLDQFLHNNPGIAGSAYRPTTLKANMDKSINGLSIGKGPSAQTLPQNEHETAGPAPEAPRQTAENTARLMEEGLQESYPGQAQEAKIAMAGLMTNEEIAYLYEDARLSML